MEICGPDPAKFALKSFTLRVLQWKVEHVKRLFMLNSSLWSNTAHDCITPIRKDIKR